MGQAVNVIRVIACGAVLLFLSTMMSQVLHWALQIPYAEFTMAHSGLVTGVTLALMPAYKFALDNIDGRMDSKG